MLVFDLERQNRALCELFQQKLPNHPTAHYQVPGPPHPSLSLSLSLSPPLLFPPPRRPAERHAEACMANACSDSFACPVLCTAFRSRRLPPVGGRVGRSGSSLASGSGGACLSLSLSLSLCAHADDPRNGSGIAALYCRGTMEGSLVCERAQ